MPEGQNVTESRAAAHSPPLTRYAKQRSASWEGICHCQAKEKKYVFFFFCWHDGRDRCGIEDELKEAERGGVPFRVKLILFAPRPSDTDIKRRFQIVRPPALNPLGLNRLGLTPVDALCLEPHGFSPGTVDPLSPPFKLFTPSIDIFSLSCCRGAEAISVGVLCFFFSLLPVCKGASHSSAVSPVINKVAVARLTENRLPGRVVEGKGAERERICSVQIFSAFRCFCGLCFAAAKTNTFLFVLSEIMKVKHLLLRSHKFITSHPIHLCGHSAPRQWVDSCSFGQNCSKFIHIYIKKKNSA